MASLSAAGALASFGEPLMASKLNRAHSERAEEFRPTWQCVLDRRRIMGQSDLFLQRQRR
jgi:hypothetical protein